MQARILLWWAALLSLFVAADSIRTEALQGEPSQPSSSQVDQRDNDQLAVAAAGVKQIIAHRVSIADRPENTLAGTLRGI